MCVASSALRLGPLEDGRVRLTMSGEIDLANAQIVVDLGVECLRRPDVETLAIDLADITFMDSTAFSAMITLLNLARETGKTLTLNRVPDRIVRLLDLTGLSRIFLIEANEPPES
jgi:anti-anti-sigma factor